MKAQFVSESLEFERGQNPKKIIGIGAHDIIRKKWDELQLSRYIGSLNIEKVNGEWCLALHVNSFPNQYSNIVNQVEKHMGEYLENPYEMQSTAIFPIKKEFVRIFIDIFNERFPDWPIKESMDFERGKETTRALKIGRREVFPDSDLFEEIHEYCEACLRDGWPKEFEEVSSINWSSRFPNFKVLLKGLAGEDPQYRFFLSHEGITIFYAHYVDAGGGRRAYQPREYKIEDMDHFIRILQFNQHYMPR